MLQSGLVSVTFRQLTPQAVISLAVSAGVSGIEWGGDVHVPPTDLEHAAQVGRWTQEAGLTVAAYGSYYRLDGGEGYASFDQVLATAKALGAPVIRVWAGTKGSLACTDPERRAIEADARSCAELAAKDGIRVALEYHGHTLTDTLESTKQLLRAIDHPNVYSYWQPPVGQAHAERVSDLSEILPWMQHLHVFQWQRDEAGETVRYALSEGEQEWRDYLQLADRPGGQRFAMLEFVRDDDPEAFIQDAAVLHEWLSELRIKPKDKQEANEDE